MLYVESGLLAAAFEVVKDDEEAVQVHSLIPGETGQLSQDRDPALPGVRFHVEAVHAARCRACSRPANRGRFDSLVFNRRQVPPLLRLVRQLSGAVLSFLDEPNDSANLKDFVTKGTR